MFVMASKIELSGDGFYETSDSEEEYTEKEKNLLKKVRAGRRRNVDSEEEVLAFDQDNESEEAESDGIIDNSDFDEDGNYDDIPDEKAWGKKRSAFYNTDFVDQDYNTYNEKEEELARQEEEEAKVIQQRLAKQLNEIDFSLDVYSETHTRDEEKSEILQTKLKSDLSGVSQRQKFQLFEKDSPEFNGLVHDFERHIHESETILEPIIKYLKSKQIKLPIVDFIKNQNNLILTYCTNVAFYLLLKSKRISVKNHPVVKRLVQLRQLLLQIDEKYQSVVKSELEEILELIERGIEFKTIDEAQSDVSKTKLNILKTRICKAKNNSNEMDVELDEEDQLFDSDHTEPSDQEGEGEEDNVEDNERRGITYQIAKNKGLTPHRKKELRNPRVKHRNKYRKAIIRRKGAVRTVRKELQKYSGEISGIKATVKKSIKLRS